MAKQYVFDFKKEEGPLPQVKIEHPDYKYPSSYPLPDTSVFNRYPSEFVKSPKQ